MASAWLFIDFLIHSYLHLSRARNGETISISCVVHYMETRRLDIITDTWLYISKEPMAISHSCLIGVS